LSASGDGRAAAILDYSYQRLNAQANELEDESIRRSFRATLIYQKIAELWHPAKTQ
jgi:hypothetical protein